MLKQRPRADCVPASCEFLLHTRADKARAYTIGRGEAAEAAAGIEISVLPGAADGEHEARIVALASRVVAMLTRLIQ